MRISCARSSGWPASSRRWPRKQSPQVVGSAGKLPSGAGQGLGALRSRATRARAWREMSARHPGDARRHSGASPGCCGIAPAWCGTRDDRRIAERALVEPRGRPRRRPPRRGRHRGGPAGRPTGSGCRPATGDPPHGRVRSLGDLFTQPDGLAQRVVGLLEAGWRP